MKRYIPLISACLLVACQSAPVPQTFEQLMLTAGTVDDAVIVATDTALKSGAITAAQASKVASITDTVQTTLKAARAAYALGNSALATTTLGTANAALTKAQACITAPATIDACLGAP